MTEAENLARLSAAAEGGSTWAVVRYHDELERLHQSGRLVLLPEVGALAEALRGPLNDFPYSTRLSISTAIHNHLKGTGDA